MPNEGVYEIQMEPHELRIVNQHFITIEEGLASLVIKNLGSSSNNVERHPGIFKLVIYYIVLTNCFYDFDD